MGRRYVERSNASQNLAAFRITHLLNATPAEEEFSWTLTRAGVFFNREYVIAGMTVDFYLPHHNLIIEIDGFNHRRGQKLLDDNRRDTYLQRRGYKVIRISNKQVYRDGGRSALQQALDRK